MLYGHFKKDVIVGTYLEVRGQHWLLVFASHRTWDKDPEVHCCLCQTAALEPLNFFRLCLIFYTCPLIGAAKEFAQDEVSNPVANDIKDGGPSSQHKLWGTARPGSHLLEQHPRLIQRMESGYESSERNSSSPVSLDAAPPECLNVYRYGLAF